MPMRQRSRGFRIISKPAGQARPHSPRNAWSRASSRTIRSAILTPCSVLHLGERDRNRARPRQHLLDPLEIGAQVFGEVLRHQAAQGEGRR